MASIVAFVLLFQLGRKKVGANCESTKARQGKQNAGCSFKFK